jgi:hypothetical protein
MVQVHGQAPRLSARPRPDCGSRWAAAGNLATCYAGAAEADEGVVAPIRAAKPVVDMLAPLPYTGLQSMFDPLFPKGIYSYAKSDYFDTIPPAMVDDMIAQPVSTEPEH